MKLELFNTLTGSKQEFKSILPNKASLYVCGPTVYSDAHIGNFRPIIVFSLLKKVLEHLSYDVTLVSNYTDIDDKIIKKAKADGLTELQVANKAIRGYEAVLKSLEIPKPDIQPRVSLFIPQIIEYVETLIKRGAAYTVDGDVYFRVDCDPTYGCLSKVKLDENEAGARIEEKTFKENPADFTIWKQTVEGLRWSSPWSVGRPGWHTECSVMINSLFPNGLIDIHGGGFDLKFPHHENEIAQSYAVNHHYLANYWIHNGFINVNGDKMSKSVGNVLLGKDACAMFGGEVVKFTILNTHYRAPINLTEETFATSTIELEKIKNTLSSLSVKIQLLGGRLQAKSNLPDVDAFFAALCDDLNVSNALTVLYKLLKEANLLLRNSKTLKSELANYYGAIAIALNTLGISSRTKKLNKIDKTLYLAYENARNEKDFAKSDEIRSILVDRKILI